MGNNISYVTNFCTDIPDQVDSSALDNSAIENMPENVIQTQSCDNIPSPTFNKEVILENLSKKMGNFVTENDAYIDTTPDETASESYHLIHDNYVPSYSKTLDETASSFHNRLYNSDAADPNKTLDESSVTETDTNNKTI